PFSFLPLILAMASLRVWLALLFCALLPPSQLADPAATAADAAKTDANTGGTKPDDGTLAATPKDAATADPKTPPGGVEPDGTPAASPTGTEQTDPKTEAGDRPATINPPPSPETSSSKQTTTSSTSTTTTTTLRAPPKPQPTAACPEPNWTEWNNTEISAYVNCKKAEKGEMENVLKCAYNPASDADNEAAVREKAMQYGRELSVCFLSNDGKRGKKWVYREELAKIMDFPLVCKTEECAGENVLGHHEYRCFWDNCNDKLEAGALSEVCRRKLVNDGKRHNSNALVNVKKIVRTTTLPPLPKPRGMDEYNELYDRMKAEREADEDFDDDEESGSHTPHRQEASSATHNQFAIVVGPPGAALDTVGIR
ncbi:hypothetical protein PRIPAC_74756, partial [Pristionchus pacificus]|uniref:Uncharacterized protein n=1 Tax=Pristionchus pacificus TaxID=54126 RepID=A0A2A6C7L1_PRIPA